MNFQRDDRRKHASLTLAVLFLLLSLSILQSSLPAPLAAMDLMEAYSRARENDPLFGSSFYEHEATKTLPAQGRSYLLPQISAYGTEAKYYYDSAPSYYRDFNSESLGVSLKQPLFSIPRFYEYRQHNVRKDIGDVRFVSAEQDLMLRVAEAYFNELAAENLLELIAVEKKAVLEQCEQAKRMFEAGVATITDVHDAEARYDSVRAREIEARSNRDVKMLALKKMVGIDPQGLNFLMEDIPLGIPEPQRLESWIEKAKENHPLLKAYAYQISYQEAELRKNEGQHWPSLDLVGGYNKTNTNNTVQTNRVAYESIGVQVNLPIFSGGYTTAKVKESRALLGQARKQYDNALADITQKLSEAFLGIRDNMSKIDALKTARKSASTSLKSNKMSLLAGVRTTIDVLNAERDLQDVRIQLLKARYEYLLNNVRLKAYAGTISEKDLQEINGWLQTAAAK
ncbi:outer membrane protein [Syntrophus gentianae]|uniref:Outer membrane protein n=1 Tax=Syntrophus gentianae TaxID=43775 RepID=A0A1H7ZQG6_9BACT|nr:TolC family outer membrane protein [Syntrophus gentianae]SEM59788.1 outer membrane protein [Syntrophus gentianae]